MHPEQPEATASISKCNGPEDTWWWSPAPVCSAAVNEEEPALILRAASQFPQPAEPSPCLRDQLMEVQKTAVGTCV